MTIQEIMDTDILTCDGDDVWVVLEDEHVWIYVMDRETYPPSIMDMIDLTPVAAHELGNKLRLAASRFR